MPERPTVVVSRLWHEERSELSFVVRSIAGGASRTRPVSVLVPMNAGTVEADGAFDLCGIGWEGSLSWPASAPADSIVVVDELMPDLLAVCPPGLYLSGEDHGGAWQPLRLVEQNGGTSPGLFVPVNAAASQHRHHGFGFTDYVLVLPASERRDEHPPDAAAWLTSAFHDIYVVVVENAVASAWKGRALRGSTSVDTRMDLWRLMAHAAVCVDLAPGSFVARECVESLRLGTPIIVPADAEVASVHARASGGSTFVDTWDLLEATDKFRNEANRSSASAQGREYANDWFGQPVAFVDRLNRRLRMFRP